MINEEELILVRMMSGLFAVVSELSTVYQGSIIEKSPDKAKKEIVKGLKAAHDKIEALLKTEEVR